ncbi:MULTISPECIES: ABC transporter ATPase [Pasteurellaceae]|uniref:ABC transporter ATPase n=1 Tax=Pasteurella atlantica TaxID=2827233 RepID=A0AAW8CHK2_9PAST|nr:ABC transporter ATPase [Pasteurella atlantica]MBR0573459.1 ABC transporter ATPase [Pasteurella atlantica]MDP8039460.1 ABC transporter ATPase [Pasteurella atlantica]MDP8041551.1 ABC transporter ATPase [Pasteurella atlantica]MDP8043688.1 ABC transporter ATPase [Pasteurella atlantica]MDP8045815.1 ABC transporter ATPase [Pasteurella atlantica]
MQKLKFLIFANFCLYLTACVSYSSQQPQKLSFNIPQSIKFDGQEYIKSNHSRLEGMEHIVYLPHNKKINTKNWQQAIFIFLDNIVEVRPAISLEERIHIRQNVYKSQHKILADLIINNAELQSKIISPPTEREHNILLEVSRGRNSQCGFGEIQYAIKRLDFAKNLPNVTAYKKEIIKLADRFKQLDWQILCK